MAPTGNSSPSDSPSDSIEDIVDDYLKEAVPPLERFLERLHEGYRLDPILESVLYGFVGKYLRMMRLLRLDPQTIGLDEEMEMTEAHGFAMNEVMSDPRIDALVEEYTVGSTQFFVMKQFGENGE